LILNESFDEYIKLKSHKIYLGNNELMFKYRQVKYTDRPGFSYLKKLEMSINMKICLAKKCQNSYIWEFEYHGSSFSFS
jgi:hypothetical protein